MRTLDVKIDKGKLRKDKKEKEEEVTFYF